MAGSIWRELIEDVFVLVRTNKRFAMRVCICMYAGGRFVYVFV